MKRLLAAAMLCAAALLLVASASQAARFSSAEPLMWRNQNYSNYTGHRDTLYKQIKVGATDTTAAFSLEGWAIPDVAASDSIVVGTVYIGTDSTATGTFTATSFTITPQYALPGVKGNYNWTSGAAITFTDVTANDQLFKLPIYIVGNTTRGPINAANWPAMRMRYLIVAIGGVVSPARAWVVHIE